MTSGGLVGGSLDEVLRHELAHLFSAVGASSMAGQRDKAMTAYERVLRETDQWNPGASSTHARARHYLARPFTEDEMQNTLRRRAQPQAQRRWWRRRRRH